MVQFIEFNAWEIDDALRNSHMVGEGGYGKVYKAVPEDRTVAIKVHKRESLQGEREFNQECKIGEKTVAVKIPNNRDSRQPLPSMREFNQEANRRALKMQVAILKKIRHQNLVTLIGACPERQILIYEFLANGSLKDHLTESGQRRRFTWKRRVRAASSICSALIFLYNTEPNPIVHGNLKTSNILFSKDNVCKLSNFAMSHLLQYTSKPVSFWGGVKGFARMLIGSDTHKIQLDVSALGIILLQLVTAQKPKDLRKNVLSKLGDIIRFQGKSMEQQHEVLKSIVDPDLKKCQLDDAAEMLFLGLKCSDPNEKHRPDLAADVWPLIEEMKSSASHRQG
uniref:RING-type E3 ubiquitin transferase n=1 Tax=Oryza glumipatula TaxID=40148 RepID=A0A0E0BL87_9ORYZ